MIKDNYLSIAPRNILIVLILMYVIPKYLKQLISRDCKRKITKEFNQPAGLAIKLKTRLMKFPKLFSNSLFNFACKSGHVNNVSDTYNAQSHSMYLKGRENRTFMYASRDR